MRRRKYEVVARTRLDVLMFGSSIKFDAKDQHVYFASSDGLKNIGYGGTIVSDYGSTGCVLPFK